MTPPDAGCAPRQARPDYNHEIERLETASEQAQMRIADLEAQVIALRADAAAWERLSVAQRGHLEERQGVIDRLEVELAAALRALERAVCDE